MESLRRGTYTRLGTSWKLPRGGNIYTKAYRRAEPSRKREQNVKRLRIERQWYMESTFRFCLISNFSSKRDHSFLGPAGRWPITMPVSLTLGLGP